MLTERNPPRAPDNFGLAPVQGEELGRDEPDLSSTPASLGLLPAISVVVAIGFALIAAADFASRRQLDWAEPMFWVGMALLLGGPLIRLLSAGPSRSERLGLVAVLTVALYLMKIAYSPDAFTFPDELAHEYNLNQALQTGHLFQPNPTLGITALFPGLAGVSSAVASAAGLPAFQSGLVVIGASRVLLTATLFLLFESLTRSARIAGLAAALYTANPNYLFYSAEYAYEALALPLSLAVILVVVRRGTASSRAVQAGWTACAMLLIAAVVVTHHVTSYAMVATLWGIVIVSLLTRRRALPLPWDLALFASIGVVAWFATIASATWLYLSGVLGLALLSMVRLITLQQAPRQVFDPSSTFGPTPIWQALLALGSVALIAIGLPFGTVSIWRRWRHRSVALLLGLAGLAYIPLQLLRLTPASWETANRSSEFLFVGVAFVLSLAVFAAWSTGPQRASRRIARVGLLTYVLIIFLGGVVVSWRPDLRLPRAYLTVAMGHEVEPEGVALARWANQFLAAKSSLATDESNALLLATYGQQFAWSGTANGIRNMLFSPRVDSGVRTVLIGVGARYVVLDRRLQSADHLVGMYPVPGSEPLQLMDAAAIAKFDAEPGVSRIADTGDIVVYDVSVLSGAR